MNNLPTNQGQEVQLPFRWSLEIRRLSTNNEEENDPYIKQNVVFCPLDDIDMLFLQENIVMTQLLHESFFDEELTLIREKEIEKGGNFKTKEQLFEPFIEEIEE